MSLFLPICSLFFLVIHCQYQLTAGSTDEQNEALRKRHIIESYTSYGYGRPAYQAPYHNNGEVKKWRTERKKRQAEYETTYDQMLDAFNRNGPNYFKKSYYNKTANYQPSNSTYENPAAYMRNKQPVDSTNTTQTEYKQVKQPPRGNYENFGNEHKNEVDYNREKEPIENNKFAGRFHPHYYRNSKRFPQDQGYNRRRPSGNRYLRRYPRTKRDLKQRYIFEEESEESNDYSTRFNKSPEDLPATNQPKHYEINIESAEIPEKIEDSYLNGQPKTEAYSFLDNGVYLIYSIQGFQLSLTLPLQKMVEDYSGGNALQICLLSNARVQSGLALEKYLIDLLNIMDQDALLESKASLKLLLVKLREFEKEMAEMMENLVNYNAEEYGTEPHQFLSFASALVIEGNSQLDYRIVN